jgi:hypothetical protein
MQGPRTSHGACLMEAIDARSREDVLTGGAWMRLLRDPGHVAHLRTPAHATNANGAGRAGRRSAASPRVFDVQYRPCPAGDANSSVVTKNWQCFDPNEPSKDRPARRRRKSEASTSTRPVASSRRQRAAFSTFHPAVGTVTVHHDVEAEPEGA